MKNKPTPKSPRQTSFLGALLCIPLLLLQSACLTAEDEAAIATTFTPDLDTVSTPTPELADSCYNDRYTQPAAEISKKIDLLFVTDTSGSLNDERQAIAQGIDSFIGALPADADFRIAVLLAHGDSSSWAGKLYRKGSEAIVLDNQTMTLTEIRSALSAKLGNPSVDNATDGGEVGLYSMSRALDPDRLADSQAAGFFRSDAALAVIFVADENDICSDFPEGVSPVIDAQGIEPAVKAGLCTQEQITPLNTFNKIKSVQGELPLLVGGIFYNNLSTVPAGGENEFGYGYSDIASLANGVVVDLANGDYETGLATIGSMVTVKLNLTTEFALTQGNVIDPASIQVRVDGAPTPYHYSVDTNSVAPISLGSALSTIDVTYCEVPQTTEVSDLCQAGSFESKPTIQIGLSMDPDEGTLPTVEAELSNMGYSPTPYTDTQIENGQLIADGVNVLIIARKILLAAVSPSYVSALHAYIENGGSVIGEYDGAALMFDTFTGGNFTIPNLQPALELFKGVVDGGGILFPMEQSTTYITNALHPVTQGVSSSFVPGFLYGYAMTDYDGTWLSQSAEFVSTGYANEVPEGTYPAILTGRCNKGRVTLFSLSYFNYLNHSDVRAIVDNSIQWVTGN